jgi:hypothetical protein
MQYQNRYKEERMKELCDEIAAQSHAICPQSLALNLNDYQYDYHQAWENFRENYETFTGDIGTALYRIPLGGGKLLITKNKPEKF